MHGGYGTGVALGLAVCVAGWVGVRGWLGAVVAVSAGEALAFDPPLVSELTPWILPGRSREFTVRLHNRGRDVAVIEELRLSCPCATGTPVGTPDTENRFPVSLAPGESLPVTVTVKSTRGERGRVELRYGVIGRIGNERVAAEALAELLFVQALNADPPVVSLGGFRRGDEPKSATVAVWSPAELVPTTTLTVETLEPALSATFAAAPSASRTMSAATTASGNVSVPLGTLTFTLDPRIAPERLKADVVVRGGTEELRIPVLGLRDNSLRSEMPDG